MGFKKGDKVKLTLRTPWADSEEEGIVLSGGKKVFLDNGVGNDPGGPYDGETGEWLGYKVPGVSKKIELLKKGNK